ncbi:MAG: LmeA family phospholipid-binding protein [Solirubrobacteraceae bacterium]
MIAALALLQQAVLPSIAQTRLRHRLERLGTVERVEVGALPALKLAFGHADRVTVRMRDSTTGRAGLADLLADTRQTDSLDASVSALRLGPLTLRDVRLGKRGLRLAGQASVGQADLDAALPPGFTVAPVASGGGVLVFAATATLFGRTVSARAFARARDGRLVVMPDVPFGDVLSLTVFSDPRVYVEGVGARPTRDGFTLTARARLLGR